MSKTVERKKTEFIAIHASATPPSIDIGEDWIRKEHMAKGWADAGYNVVIRRNGKIEIARPLDHKGAHVKGFNSISVGVCLIGGVDEFNQPKFNFTNQQMEALALTITFLRASYPDAIVQGHRDFYGDTNKDGVIDSRDWLKKCPCFDVKNWLDERGMA